MPEELHQQERAEARPLHSINPGFSRLTVPQSSYPDPWRYLHWWESAWQAEAGLQALCRQPFFPFPSAPGEPPPERIKSVPTRALYPSALQSSETDRIKEAARSVAAQVRQARELYQAAQSLRVTDLSRPLLYS